MATAHIYIFGPIGQPDIFEMMFGNTLIDKADIRRQFESFEDPTDIVVHIDSIGGEVTEGFAIHDYLRAQNLPVTTIAEGMVYSIATVIFLAGDRGKRFSFPNSDFLIHNPFIPMTGGDADSLENDVELLRRKENQIIDFYNSKTGISKEHARELMSVETFFGAKEAIDFGFVDQIKETNSEMVARKYGRKAVAFIKEKNNEMTEQEAKKATGLFAEIQKLVAKFKNEETPVVAETPEPVVEITSTWEAERDEMQKRIDELEAELQAKATEAEAVLASVKTLTEKTNADKALIAEIQNRVKELEAIPLVVSNSGKEAVIKTEAIPHHWDAIADKIKKQYANRS